MPWPVYSERLLASADQNVWVNWMVPAGMRCIVKSVVVVNGLANPATVHVVVGGVYALLVSFPAAIETYSYDMAAVAYAGEFLQLVNVGTSANTRLDGYLLNDPSGREGPMESVGSLPAPMPIPSLESYA
jgi:hypothetical protein